MRRILTSAFVAAMMTCASFAPASANPSTPALFVVVSTDTGSDIKMFVPTMAGCAQMVKRTVGAPGKRVFCLPLAKVRTA